MDALGSLQTQVKRVESVVGKDAPPMRTWVFDRNGVWYVGWYDLDRKRHKKSCGPGAAGRRTANKLAEKINAELVTGTYNPNAGKTWAEFRVEYEAQIASGKAEATQREIGLAFDVFERIASPARMTNITTATVDKFASARRKEDSKRTPGEKVSPATVNKELRHIKSALTKARKWGYLPTAPEVEMLPESQAIKGYVPPEDFAKLYRAADKAALPDECQGYSRGDWWRAFLVFAYMTGWRLGQILALRRDDVEIHRGADGTVYGIAIARAGIAGNKAKRERRTALHPLVIIHMEKLVGFSDRWLDWPHHRRTIDNTFHGICRDAGVPEYGFHDLRRGFATMNADRMTADALQEHMQHASYLTTKRYISVGRQLVPAMQDLYVPELKSDGACQGPVIDSGLAG